MLRSEPLLGLNPCQNSASENLPKIIRAAEPHCARMAAFSHVLCHMYVPQGQPLPSVDTPHQDKKKLLDN